MKTKGWAVATVLRGRFVMRDFAMVSPTSAQGAGGQPIRFVETLEPA
jgi:hypothetical protein